jgi:hypothetical protein
MKSTPKSHRWGRLLVGAAGVAVLAGWGSVALAQSDEPILDPNATLAPNATGQCTASATIAGGFTIDPYASSGVYVVPLTGSANYSGSVAVAEGPRPASGKVEIETPPGIPSISLDDQWTWGPEVTGIAKTGTVTWELSDWLPRDVELTVSGVHNENGAIFCTGSVKISFDGSPWDSPITPLSVGGTALALGGLAWTARPKGVA